MRKLRRSLVALVFMGAWCFAFDAVQPASANWFSWGSNGSSGGSGGGSWGSWGSHGSSGGWGGSWFGGWASHGSSGGSWGSYGSSGGSYGSGGGYYAAPVAQANPAAPSSQVAYLNVNVPANAKVFLQGQRMALTGVRRRFVTPELADGKPHVYTVKVEIDQNGQRISKTVEAVVRAGQDVEVTVALDPQKPTSLVSR